MDAEQAAEIIDAMAEKMRHYATQLDELAKGRRSSVDITYAADACKYCEQPPA